VLGESQSASVTPSQSAILVVIALSVASQSRRNSCLAATAAASAQRRAEKAPVASSADSSVAKSPAHLRLQKFFQTRKTKIKWARSNEKSLLGSLVALTPSPLNDISKPFGQMLKRERQPVASWQVQSSPFDRDDQMKR
jgi:hypothetical protein